MSVQCIPPYTHFYKVKLGFTLVNMFSYFCSETWIVGTRWNRLTEAVQRVPAVCVLGKKREKKSKKVELKLSFLQPLSVAIYCTYMFA